MYLLVLATSAMVAIVGVSALMAARLGRAQAALRADAAAAETLARAGLVALANRVGRDAAYAEAAASAGWSEPVALGEGSYRTRVDAAASAGVYPVRVRAAVGDSVRVHGALLREPQRLGPELLTPAGFSGGLSPTVVRGEAEASLEREAERVYVEVSKDGDGWIGLGREVDPEPGAVYRLAVLARTQEGGAAVGLGFERDAGFVTRADVADAWLGADWTEVEAERAFPASLTGGASRVFIQTDANGPDLHVARISLRRVLPAVPAEPVPGSLHRLADDPAFAGAGEALGDAAGSP